MKKNASMFLLKREGLKPKVQKFWVPKMCHSRGVPSKLKQLKCIKDEGLLGYFCNLKNNSHFTISHWITFFSFLELFELAIN